MLIKICQDAYQAGSYYRLPTEDGKPSVFAMQGSWYEAKALDDNGAEYLVIWDIREDWNGDDESDACNWEKPFAVVQIDPWRDVTNAVKFV